MLYTGCFKKLDIIWNVQGVSQKILFHNLISWLILVQMISKFSLMFKHILFSSEWYIYSWKKKY